MTKLKFIFAILATLMMPSALWAAGDTTEDARAALDAGDFSTAAKILEVLAAQGNASAQVNLGVLYIQGKGVKQDDKMAARWFDKAARQGNGGAALNLGTLYRNGQGVDKDLARASMWIEMSLLSVNGEDRITALRYRSKLAKEMSADEITSARDMIDNCQQAGVKYCD